MFDVGARVYQVRKDLGFTQGELADKLSVVSETIYRIENNRTRPSLNFIESLCGMSGITIQEFFCPGYEERITTLNQWTPEQKIALKNFLDTL